MPFHPPSAPVILRVLRDARDVLVTATRDKISVLPFRHLTRGVPVSRMAAVHGERGDSDAAAVDTESAPYLFFVQGIAVLRQSTHFSGGGEAGGRTSMDREEGSFS